jgi:hypothetical protein
VILFQVIAFDELKTDYKNPIDQCNSLNPVSFKFVLLGRVILALQNVNILGAGEE